MMKVLALILKKLVMKMKTKKRLNLMKILRKHWQNNINKKLRMNLLLKMRKVTLILRRRK